MAKKREAAPSPAWPADKVERRKVASLIPYARNSRTHSDAQIDQLAAAIQEWGFANPVLIAEDGTIIAGHGRVLAAKQLGLTEIPVMVAKGWSDAQRRAFVIADNKLTLNGGWDSYILRAEFADLEVLDFDLGKLGFNLEELAGIRDVRPTGATDPEETPEPPATPTALRGDLWALGRHRILCGDSLDIDQVRRLTAGVVPDIANCDPPYGISIVSSSATDGGANALPPSRCWLVWDKENTGSFADAELAWTNQDAVVRLLRHQWSGLIKASERGERRVHPTQKPVALAEWVIDTLAPEAKTAIDLFLGSGSTLMACERRGIACYGVEMAEAYIDVIIQRWQNFTNLTATLDGKSFAEVKAERLKQAA